MTDNSKKIRMNGQFLWQLGFEEPLDAHDKVYGFKKGSSGLQSASLVEVDDVVNDQKGQPNGIAPLNNASKLDNQYLNFDVDQLQNDVSTLQSGLTNETYNREQSDILLQQQIDAITGGSDVLDVVGTYQELENYDTLTLSNNDIVKVLDDNTHDNAISYYRWVITEGVGAWVYLGSLGPFYTKAESLATFVPLTRTINGQSLETDITISTGGTTPRFSINNGNKNAQGVMDVLDNSTTNVLAFKVDDGSTYAPLVATDGYTGEQFTKTSLNSISMNAENVSEGTYNVFIPKTGNQPYLLNNVIFVQAEKPVDTPTDTIPVMTSNTTPYGTITLSGYTDATIISNAVNIFKQGQTTNSIHGVVHASATTTFTYTYDENYQPQAGIYQIKYTQPTGHLGKVNNIKVTKVDNTVITFNVNSTISYTANVTVDMNIKSISIEGISTGGAWFGALQLLKPAITAEGTIWVNNGVEPLEVKVRDENASWVPFYDVLAGTVTVNSSHNITAVSNIGFNYFSTINMHNISTTAHQDIRADISSLKTLTTQINRTGTSSYQGLTKLYTSTGTATDGTMTQNAIKTELDSRTKKLTAQNTALTPTTNNKVTWTITNSLNTADVIVMIRKVSDNSVVQADITTTASTITITMNAESAVSANTYRVVVIG